MRTVFFYILFGLCLFLMFTFCNRRKPTYQTEHIKSLILRNGKPFYYKVRTDHIIVSAITRSVQASIFFIEYSREPKQPGRPCIFCWNGGPGNSSMWLHLGSIGPKRINKKHLENNPETLLVICDLIFVDPPGTGFSRSIDCDPLVFYSHQMDGEIHAAFIAKYLRIQDAISPLVFLFGESYGGARACMVTQLLQEKFNIFVRGVVLISPSLRVIHGTQDREGDGNDLPYLLSLPSETAVAHYYQKLSPRFNQMNVNKVAELSYQFATGLYNLVLMQGANIGIDPTNRWDPILANLEHLTGIPRQVWMSKSLRLSLGDFISRLLSLPKRPVLIGQMDGRFSCPGKMADPEHPRTSDPYRMFIYQVFSSKLQEYFSHDLQLPLDSLPPYISRAIP